MTVWVVISVFNRRDYTEKCLTQLVDQPYQDLKIIVVDDGSSDGTSVMIKEGFPDVWLIQSDGSLYWTGSMNVGVDAALKECAEDDYILVVNDDLVFDKQFVESFVTVSQRHPNAMIHACNIYLDNKDVIEFGGLKINWWTAMYSWRNKVRKRREFEKGHVERSDLLWGRGLLVPVSVIKQCGNYDRRYQQSGDPEFSRRAAKAGYELLVTYDVVAYMYPENKPNINVRREYALREVKDYFSSVLSQGRIKTLYLDSFLMANNILQGAIFFCFHFSRHLWHFLRHVRRF